jgi:hypothetical protein
MRLRNGGLLSESFEGHVFCKNVLAICPTVPGGSQNFDGINIFYGAFGAKLYVHCGIHIFILRGMTKYT